MGALSQRKEIEQLRNIVSSGYRESAAIIIKEMDPRLTGYQSLHSPPENYSGWPRSLSE